MSATEAGGDRALARAAAGLAPIGLGDIAEAGLMDRTDTKYVLPAENLPWLVAEVAGDYRVLEIAGTRIGRYETLYFDTEDLALFRAHHQGRAERFKVRERHYATTGGLFLEVKRRTVKGRTVKTRVETADWLGEIPAGADGCVTAAAPSLEGPLRKSLFNSYRRMTLVSHSRAERVTLDTGLTFRADDVAVALDGLAIAEVKRDDPHARSEFMNLMRRAGIRPLGLSKYCLGITLLHPDVKHNRFKPRIRAILKTGRVVRRDS